MLRRTRTADDAAGMHTPAGPGVMRSLESLLHDLPGLVSDRIHLLSLELKLASGALAQIVGLLIASAVLLVTAWLTTWVALAVAALRAGVHWGLVVAVVLLLNVGACVLALLRIKALSTRLTLPATKRRLTIAPLGETAGPHGEAPPPMPEVPPVPAVIVGDAATQVVTPGARPPPQPPLSR